jgi:hypothetical protein
VKNISSLKEYFEALGSSPELKIDFKDALKTALDERARELDFYWKRTTYAWTLNAAVFAGYFALRKEPTASFTSLGVVACLGFVCAIAWWCLNRGSKYWQENWELQVDLLESAFHRPLHRINPDVGRYRLLSLNRAYPFSVTKVNQHLSLFISLVWFALVIDAAMNLKWSLHAGSPLLSIVVGLSVLATFSFWKWGLSTPHHAVLGKTFWLSYEPVDMTEELPATETRGENQAV